jgi:N-acetylglucosamine-6-phosphate deacetylase
MMAITDATSVAGLPIGARARLGDQAIIAGEHTALLDDGTLAGSTLTMDGAFRNLVNRMRLPLSDAARMCATTPAESMGQAEIGSIAEGKWADVAILGRDLRVRQTYLAGEPAL